MRPVASATTVSGARLVMEAISAIVLRQANGMTPVPVGVSLAIWTRFAYFYVIEDEGSGHVQSLILGAVLFIAAVQLAALGILGDVLAGTPGRMLMDLPTDLPRPRDQLVTRELSGYLAARHRIGEALRAEDPGD